MKKKDVLELKRRFKKDECTFTRMCGCYVNSEKNIILDIEETFLNIEEDEFFKYLEIAKKTLSGTIGNNLLELNFIDASNMADKQKFLMDLKKSQLKDKDLLNEFYNSIIQSYDYEGNYLIIVFHDAYDVIRKTTDNAKLDESEEVYEYILCAICPVTLSKPGLGYLQDENRIGARIRDWVVELPSQGFLFPAFTERSTDIDSVMYYTKNPKDTHPELMEEGLGCIPKQTATEQKETFHEIVRRAIDDDKKSDDLILEIQENINNLIDEHEAIYDKNTDEPVVLTNNAITDILNDSGIPQEITSKIEESYTEKFGDTPPAAEYLLDTKALAANAEKKKQKELEKKVEILEQKLEKTQQDIIVNTETGEIYEDPQTDDIIDSESDSKVESNEETMNNSTSEHHYDVVLQVKPEKIPQIKSQIIDGKKCIIIPMDDDEQANVNGNDTLV